MPLCRLNFCIDLFFGRVIFSYRFWRKTVTQLNTQKCHIHNFHSRLLREGVVPKKYGKSQFCILYPNTFKEFYYHKKFLKSIMNMRCSAKKALPKNFAIFTWTHLYWGLYFNKNAGLQASIFIKKRLQHRCFLDNTSKFLRAAILKNIFERTAASVSF